MRQSRLPIFSIFSDNLTLNPCLLAGSPTRGLPRPQLHKKVKRHQSKNKKYGTEASPRLRQKKKTLQKGPSASSQLTNYQHHRHHHDHVV
jgi:hypothetical protein